VLREEEMGKMKLLLENKKAHNKLWAFLLKIYHLKF